jgi:3-(3-hydroxy-phenyl)propionate hydroxylase
MPCPDAPLDDGYLLSNLGGTFTVLAININVPDAVHIEGIDLSTRTITVTDNENQILGDRFLGNGKTAVYLVRPDQHIIARWPNYDAAKIRNALNKALGKPE